jgi:TldD protein
MYKFPEHFYTDVRIEEAFDTKISFKKGILQEQKVRRNIGAFIRVFDGNRWYYSATTDIDHIQDKIDALAEMGTANPEILEHPIVKRFQTNRDTILSYAENSVEDVPVMEKQTCLSGYLDMLEDPTIVHHTAMYVDNRTVKTIYTSKGTEVKFDNQTCGIRFNLELAHGDKKDQSSISKAGITFDDIKDIKTYVKEQLEKTLHFVKNAEPVTPGEYVVLMSPLTTGVFTHESFGHKSESDFMVGDPAMKAEWALGKKVGADLLTIIDDGHVTGNGYSPFDDEGNRADKTYIVTDGALTGRLHSTATATVLDEAITGNARAVGFEFEPIVRMTTTYIQKGTRPLSEIVAEIDKGIYIENIKHGSGMSTFTIAPNRAYKIENGQITTPVKISVVTGNVFETLGEVDAVSSEFELLSFVGGGCGKMEQYPLPVGFGGPYTRVKRMNVQ